LQYTKGTRNPLSVLVKSSGYPAPLTSENEFEIAVGVALLVPSTAALPKSERVNALRFKFPFQLKPILQNVFTVVKYIAT
jgi:hypothetical protein